MDLFSGKSLFTGLPQKSKGCKVKNLLKNNIIRFLNKSMYVKHRKAVIMFNEYTEYENIQRCITRLDQVAVDYECRWGVGRLEKLVSPDMAEKWDRQKEKLDKAIQDRDVREVAALVEGSIRGYKVLEDNALLLGHKYNAPEIWEVKHPETNEVFRIVKSNNDYDMAVNGEAHVFTLQEVARILSSHTVINQVKDVFPDAQVTKIAEKDFFNDNLPF